MPIQVQIEGKGMVAEFPDGTDPAVINAAIKRDYFGGSKPAPTPAPDVNTMPPIEGAIDIPPGKQEMRGGIRTLMEGGGQYLGELGGAAAGTAVAPGPGTLAGGFAGGTGGYAVGSKGADLFLGEDTGSWKQKLAEGAAFTVAPKLLSKGIEKLGRGAVRSALKIPPTQANTQTAKSAVDTIIKENLAVTSGETFGGGATKARNIINTIEKQMDDVLNQSGSTVNVKDVIDVIESQKSRFVNFRNPAKANNAIDRVIADLEVHPNVINPQYAVVDGKPRLIAGEIPIAKAQQMKKSLYKELDQFYKNAQAVSPSKAIANKAESVGMAGEAEALRKQIMSDPTIPPEATDWLKREGNIMNALRWIERRSNVAANMDPITFNDVLLGGLLREGVPYAVAMRIARMPWTLSKAGIGMAKAGPYLKEPLQIGGIATKNLLGQ